MPYRFIDNFREQKVSVTRIQLPISLKQWSRHENRYLLWLEYHVTFDRMPCLRTLNAVLAYLECRTAAVSGNRDGKLVRAINDP